MKIALLHPGQMGVSIGSALLTNQHDVVWLNKDRSQATIERAEGAGFVGYEILNDLVTSCDAVVSVCPPEAALQLATEVAQVQAKVLFVDANAISPATASKIANLFGDHFVDGGIIGPPAIKLGSTRLYLSGVKAAKVASWFVNSLVQAEVLGTGIATASMLKMCYAAYTKGHAALLANVRALALAGGVEDSLFDEWQISQAGLAERSKNALSGIAPKAWRFKAEMEEIVATFKAHHLPTGFHEGAAEVYERLLEFKNQTQVDPSAVVRRIVKP